MRQETIVALSTGKGGAVSIIRISGDKSIEIIDNMFRSLSGKKITDLAANRLIFGSIEDLSGDVVDEVVVSIFRAPHSYTGEDIIEISCHASQYINQKIIELVLHYGARVAMPGEFTQRAYLAGKLDLVQAEAVADIIASNSATSHRMAINQIKGSYSAEFSTLREQLLHLVSMLELELDFGEEEVEFADRTELINLLNKVINKISKLISSFKQGNAIKNGVPIAIVGAPNAGKSTLLNALLGEERAIVSHIAGTTRDSIEECVTLGGVVFRFIDTAGIRSTTDHVESLGIERTFKKIDQADLIIVMVDPTDHDPLSTLSQITTLPHQEILVAINKTDITSAYDIDAIIGEISSKYPYKLYKISAKENQGIDSIQTYLEHDYAAKLNEESVTINNLRHLELLTKALESSQRALNLLQTAAPTDLIATDTRQTITHITSIIGDITPNDILGYIFGHFCIGK